MGSVIALPASQHDQKCDEAALSEELRWYNGSFNPRQLDPQGSGSGCFHSAPICTGGGTTEWQAALWRQRNKIGYNSSLRRGNMRNANKAWGAICRGKVFFLQKLVLYLFFPLEIQTWTTDLIYNSLTGMQTLEALKFLYISLFPAVMLIGQGTDSFTLVIFQTPEGLWPLIIQRSKAKSNGRGTNIVTQKTVLCYGTVYHLVSSQDRWGGGDPLGGGLRSPCAFLVVTRSLFKNDFS